MKQNELKQKQTFNHDLFLFFVKLLNIILITVPFAFCWYLYYAERIVSPFYHKGNFVVIGLLAILYYILAKLYDGLHLSILRISEMIYSQILAMLIADGVIYIVICILSKKMSCLWPGIACIAVQTVFICLWCCGAHHIYFRVYEPQKSIIIYDMRKGMGRLIDEYGLTCKFNVQEIIKVDDCLKDLSKLDVYQTVFLSGVHSSHRNVILKYCVAKDINLYIIPRIGDVIMSGAKQMHMFHLPMLNVGRYNPSVAYIWTKRAFDIIISAIVLIITSPIFLAAAIAVKTDGGPVFYKQERLTKDGKVFKVIKFRSMRVDAEKDGVARLSSGNNDDRITKAGKIIRRVRIDELPQLINILVGDMTLVGPRPERPSIAAEYEKELPEFQLRLQTKAGLTGYAQVYGKYNTTPYDKLVMDLMYIANPSIVEDLKIMMATVKILFSKESTEGVAEWQTTAIMNEYTEKDV